ncbi:MULTISPECIES: hypothetical protein [unclassified Microbacterium]|nr:MULTISPECIES: hypothetical protein [unclassified Microbacterium]MDH5134551.1 hypothetical protein [Microbacterium sp. RD10]MDH5136965.1 hypothetical protein [Microbacterium sp. RD11]MDH5146001.1 hypothetical protein [Microbacterium sp. RD12]MDH5153353.1 hypothetical protein [Microbacterium sp. RD06]MDH5167415.1 hypothetical protein [Microbacterium sp. RD02]
MVDDERDTASWCVAGWSSVRQHLSREHEPTPGSIWRARWDDIVQLVLVDAAPDASNRVRVTPVGIGDEDADETTVVVPAEETELNEPLSIWVTLTTDVGAITLDRQVATMKTYHSADDVATAAQAGSLRCGYVVANDSSPRRAQKKILEYTIQALTHAARLRGGRGTLQERLRDITISELADALGGDTPLAVKLKRGKVVLDEPQAERVAEVTGLDAEELLDANPAPPARLVQIVNDWHRGEPLRAVARRRDEPESEVFTQLTQSVLGLAARGEKRDTVDWAGRVDTYLHMAMSD